jgi:hypothetical protein
MAALVIVLALPAAASAYVPTCIGYDGEYGPGDGEVAGTCSAPGTDTYRITITQPPARGTATVVNQDTYSASVVYTPTWAGADTVKFRATSDGDESEEITIAINNVGLPEKPAPPPEPEPDPPPTADPPPPAAPPPADDSPLSFVPPAAVAPAPPPAPETAPTPTLAPPAALEPAAAHLPLPAAAGPPASKPVTSAAARAKVKRRRALAKCRRISSRTRKGRVKRRACARRANAIGKPKRSK